MRIKFSFMGDIADDFAKSHYSNPQDFLADIQHEVPLCRCWKGQLFKIAYLKDREEHLPEGIPFFHSAN